MEGSGGAAFFIISSGEAKVSSKGVNLATLGPGEYFGEVALIDGGPRSATVDVGICRSAVPAALFWDATLSVNSGCHVGQCRRNKVFRSMGFHQMRLRDHATNGEIIKHRDHFLCRSLVPPHAS
ncbi:cyclic nucleotide-binding domain-containing protein [Bradyrhizobium sp. AZCC 2289]|uniref:cyclic nucleotide-binding domain-containing protein n=1 Tax=Bradyrhizobium sp. AZCC 2289 TaxID=3117026 RepID=UPI003FA5E598